MLAVMSMFRSCGDEHLRRFFAQVADLPKESTRLLLVEGDSVNDTRKRVRKLADASGFDYQLIIREHGGPHMGSVENPERMRQCAFAANGAFEAVGADIDHALWVESDLIWSADMVARLAAQLQPGIDVIAPSIFAGKLFYDVWGFRDLKDQRFSWFEPFSKTLLRDRLTEVKTVGSCLIMRGEVARTCRLTTEEALVGFCHNARSKGYRVWVDWRERVNHP